MKIIDDIKEVFKKKKDIEQKEKTPVKSPLYTFYRSVFEPRYRIHDEEPRRL